MRKSIEAKCSIVYMSYRKTPANRRCKRQRKTQTAASAAADVDTDEEIEVGRFFWGRPYHRKSLFFSRNQHTAG